MCRSFRRRGICEVLLHGTPERLHHFLAMSGHAYLYSLSQGNEETLLTSRAPPLLDALACGDQDTARAIALHNSKPLDPRREYEEDFLFMQCLVGMVTSSPVGDEERAPRARPVVLARQPQDARSEVVESLHYRNAEQFNTALTQLLDEEHARWLRLQEKGRGLEEDAATEMHVCVEGLALLRLAEQRGLHVLTEYLAVPSLVRVKVPNLPGPEAWKDPARW
ncbi:Imm49 family immunity protein [Hyalangium versicolor]|uniref:Imm49 family immunity protein n=1 Tax=Hyalangium versicolor TaxID=2861190 RepID=UPI0035A15AD2